REREEAAGERLRSEPAAAARATFAARQLHAVVVRLFRTTSASQERDLASGLDLRCSPQAGTTISTGSVLDVSAPKRLVARGFHQTRQSWYRISSQILHDRESTTRPCPADRM